MKNQLNNCIFTIFTMIATILPIAGSPLFADNLQIGLELMQGSLQSELEPMFNQDTAINDNGFTGVILSDWQESSNAPARFSVFYFHDTQKYSVFGGIRFAEYRPTYDAGLLGIYSFGMGFGSYGIEMTEKYQDLEFGIQIPLENSKLTLSPKIGRRATKLVGTLNGTELVNGSGITGIETSAGGFNSDANGIYLGLDLEYRLNEKTTLLFEYIPVMNLRGTMGYAASEGTSLFGGGSSISSFGLRFGGSSSDIEGIIYSLGMRYKINPLIDLTLAYRTENYNVSYPGFLTYFGYSYNSLTGGSSEVVPDYDLISDLMFYGQVQSRKKEHLTFGIVFRIDAGG